MLNYFRATGYFRYRILPYIETSVLTPVPLQKPYREAQQTNIALLVLQFNRNSGWTNPSNCQIRVLGKGIERHTAHMGIAVLLKMCCVSPLHSEDCLTVWVAPGPVCRISEIVLISGTNRDQKRVIHLSSRLIATCLPPYPNPTYRSSGSPTIFNESLQSRASPSGL